MSSKIIGLTRQQIVLIVRGLFGECKAFLRCLAIGLSLIQM
jgi:hypothetical protein